MCKNIDFIFLKIYNYPWKYKCMKYRCYTPLVIAIIHENLRFICMLKGKKPIAHYTFGKNNNTILHIAYFPELKIIKNKYNKLYNQSYIY